MKGKFKILIPQISVFTLIQNTFSSLHSLFISSIYVQSSTTTHDRIGYTTFNIFEPFCAHWIHQTYVGPQVYSMFQGH